MKISINRDKYNDIFFLHMLQNYMLENKEKMHGTGVKMAITATELGDELFLLPPIELQNKFADFVKQIDKSKLVIQNSLEKLETLKKALMQEYFG